MSRITHRVRSFTHRHRGWILFGTSVALCAMAILALWAATLQLPDLSSFDTRKVSQSTKIYDRTGQVLLYDIHQNIQRTVVPFEAISRNIKNATVAIEDSEFYQHHGIKISSIFRSILVNVGSFGFNQGGSTITQQVIKNALLTDDKTIARKIKEWVLSLKLEQNHTKEEILGLYLNETPYGGNLYGIEEASRSYFGKDASDLTLAQAAYLAALPQAPTYFSPYGQHKDALEARKNLVLKRMLDLGFITKSDYDAAQKEVVTFLPRRDKGILAPHFVDYVRSYLEEKYGQKMIDESGLKVTTTLDYTLQEKAEEIVKRNALNNKEKFNAENAGLVAIDPTNGNILVMVGSRDYFDKQIDGNFNVTLANRQPGSAFKPFVYATAFKKGFTPDTVVFDLKTQFSTLCDPTNLSDTPPCYSPENYDHVYRGPVTFRNALAQSINVPAVKALYLAGMKDSLQTAQDLGITTLEDIGRYGLTLVLGGGEVSLLEMTSAYGVFANEGVRNPPLAVLKVEDSEGNVLEEATPHPTKVLDDNVALQISDVLSDNTARSPAFGETSSLYFPGRSVAVKTGTTNDYRDAWVIGYTPTIAIGAWAGNNNNTPMEKKVAGFIVAPMWHEFVDFALQQVPEIPFTKPRPYQNNLKPVLRGIWQGGETYVLDKTTGKLATDLTPPETRDEHVIQSVHSILYWVDRSNPTGPKPTNPTQDPQFSHWEYPVRLWAAAKGFVDQQNVSIPTATDDVHTPTSGPTIILSGLQKTYRGGERLSVTVSSAGRFSLSKTEVYVNGVFVGSNTTQPLVVSFVPSDIEGIQENNTLRVVGYDTVWNRGENTFHFTYTP